MTQQALRLPKKLEPSPEKRERRHSLAVCGETGEVAMNDGHTDILFAPLATAGGRPSTATV
ncbi:hypothetical protein CO666_07890 [Rhizobium chutanense]|uniref:Uncharacterized protein n=1 Tax=Rhizobium chutanense TaxID=2035448 RepID=A0A2A6JF67_9HYPH|nr:hypothetical protein [Rhizobium chutanense]PDT04660.1 hypothetical protein CO666_07890 [Rhizobium chutanense]